MFLVCLFCCIKVQICEALTIDPSWALGCQGWPWRKVQNGPFSITIKVLRHISLPMSLFLRGNSKQLIFHFIIFFLISYWLRLSSKLSSMICAFLYPNLTLDPSTPLLFSPSASSASRITFSSSWRSRPSSVNYLSFLYCGLMLLILYGWNLVVLHLLNPFIECFGKFSLNFFFELGSDNNFVWCPSPDFLCYCWSFVLWNFLRLTMLPLSRRRQLVWPSL